MQAKQEQPGSVKRDGMMPLAGHAVKQRRNVRDLNTRLEMYVRSQQEKSQQITRLKELKAKQEQEFKLKLEQSAQKYEETLAALRKEKDSFAFESAHSAERLSEALEARKESEAKLLLAESKKAELAALAESLRIEHERNAKQLDAVRSEYASLRYKYESYSVERAQLDLDRVAQQKASERLKRDVAAKEEAMSAERESLHKLCAEKDGEAESLRAEMAALELQMTAQTVRLRQELELKLGAFVEKREEQYKQEKAEWMRIFKDEFNRKLSSYKSANAELKSSNCKLNDDIAELRTRLAKLKATLKAQKSELEAALRESEEEQERMRVDIDARRRRQENEAKALKGDNLELRDALKAKSIELEELAVMKMQLDAEIELYRNILNEAEQCAGYKSPFHSVQNSKGTATRNSRKRKRFNNHGDVEMEQRELTAQLNTVRTPGVARAAKMAANDVKEALTSPLSEMGALDAVTECKDCEVSEEEEMSLSATPRPSDNIEGATLQFSGLDLNEGMIEIQNTGEKPIWLGGYTLCNAAGTAQYELPSKMELHCTDKLRIYVGEQMFAAVQAQEQQQLEDDDGDISQLHAIVGDYDGAYVFWGKDVWTGKDDDCARLYNPQQQEVALIEISPEMVDKTTVKDGCCVM